MFKISLALLLILRLQTVPVESNGASISGVTVSHGEFGCPNYYYDRKWKRVCEPSVVNRGSSGSQASSTVPPPIQKPQTEQRRDRVRKTMDQGGQQDTNPRSGGSGQPMSTVLSAPGGGEQQAEGVSGASNHGQNQKSLEALSDMKQPGFVGSDSGKVPKSEQSDRGSEGYEGQSQGMAVTSPHAESDDGREVPGTTVRSAFSGSQQGKTQEVETAPRQPIEKKKENSGMQVPRNDNEHATRPQQSSAISEPERRNTLGIATAGEDEQGSRESSVEIKNSGVGKGHAVAFSALFSFMCS